MVYKRYGLEENSDGTWHVIDYHEGSTAEMHGTVLNRLPHDVATDLMIILNAEEKRRAETEPQHPKEHLMATGRYSRRKNLNNYWAVVDAVTGQAVVIDGVVMDMLTEEDAEELVERLNLKDEEGKPFSRP
ncbi:hypothetical protein IE4872_PD01641 (plasmid) [Rhizobium gallicum]|uniref:Uncharacterized protein n=1 Tax=Rhizobium gallicum TaxID=56730 RepID=A0A1L5NW81_9HYPH|nr:hypothetical protein IE4872_PD01641 [Rhizobium gallicum]